MNKIVRKYLAAIGRKGGQRSRRSLTPDEARAMVRVREARRAYRAFHASCFWSYPPDLSIRLQDVAWVAEQLMKHGGRREWERGARLCR